MIPQSGSVVVSLGFFPESVHTFGGSSWWALLMAQDLECWSPDNLGPQVWPQESRTPALLVMGTITPSQPVLCWEPDKGRF